MSEAVRYLLAVEVLGLVGAPLAARALGRLPGRGLAFGRILAWLLLAWLVWLGGSLGVANGLPLVLVVAAGLAVAAVVFAVRDRGAERDPFDRRLWLSAEAVFVGSLLLAVWLGAHSPDVLRTEKPMDMMLMNATLTSDAFPPRDLWLSGETVNYYYLGQHMVALLIRVTGVEPSVGYNLGLAVVVATSASTAFALAATVAEAGRRQGLAIRRPLVAGVSCVVLLLVMGSLRGGKEALDELGSLTAFDYFGVTRVIPNTINEFPAFSFTLGDVHAHVVAIPLTLLALAFVVTAGLHGAPRRDARGVFETGCAALAIGWLYTVNSWSWPVLAGLLALAVIACRPDVERWGRTAAWAAGVVVAGVVLVLPFILDFDPNAGGVSLTTTAQRESFWDFARHHAVMEGALLLLLLVPLLARLARARRRLPILGGLVVACGIGGPLLGGADLAGAVLVALLLAGTLALVLARSLTAVERLAWVIAAGALACLLAAEIGIVEDGFFGGPFARMNTVFKLGYEAWLLLAVFGAVALSALRTWLPRPLAIGTRIVAVVLIALGSMYTVGATAARHGGLEGPLALDGRTWLDETAGEGEIGAIDWIREHTPEDAVVLEFVDDSYGPFGNGRISTFTGRPTVVGWEGHERQWNHDPGARRQDVIALYRETDPAAARDLARRYGVDFVVVGPLERDFHGSAPALRELGREVYAKAGTAVYELPG